MTAPCHHGVPDTETCAWLTFLLTSGWPVRSARRRTAWRQYRRPPTLTFASSSPVGNSSRSSPGRPLPLRAWVPGQERVDEGRERRSILEQEPVPGIGVEHHSCPGDEACEDVVVGDRVELVFGAVGDERGH